MDRLMATVTGQWQAMSGARISLGVKCYRPLTAPSPGGMKEAAPRSTVNRLEIPTDSDTDELNPVDPSDPSTVS